MDINDILALQRESKLTDCTKPQLEAMRAECVRRLNSFNGNIAHDLIIEIDQKIRQKDAAEDQIKTLFWARLAALAGVAGVAGVALVVVQICQSCASTSDTHSQIAAPHSEPLVTPPPALVSPTNYNGISTNKAASKL
jgi:hypothetical protein